MRSIMQTIRQRKHLALIPYIAFKLNPPMYATHVQCKFMYYNISYVVKTYLLNCPRLL